MRLTGGEIVAEYLIRENVPYVVGIPGHGNLALVDAFRRRQDKLSVIQVRQENCAVHLADGYYRASGQPLAAFTSIGPGAMNTAIGLATAYVESTAVLALTGDTHVHMWGRGVLQEIERDHSSNFPRAMEPLVKRYWHVTQASQLPHVMQRAFNQMLSGRPGPALIDLPMDVQADSADVDIPSPLDHRAAGVTSGDPEQIEKAVELLASADRPVIIVGGGVISADASEELIRVAELAGAAVINTVMGIGAFPGSHPLYAWCGGSKGTNCGNALARSADVLLAVGCRFADETTSSYRRGSTYSIPPTRLIHVDIDATEIGKNYPVEVGVVGDCRPVLMAVADGLEAAGLDRSSYRDTDYFAEIQRRRAEWHTFLQDCRDDTRSPVMIGTLLQEARAFLDRDAIVVSSSGNTQAQMLQEFPFDVPRTCISSGGFSTMGFTVPAAMGAKLARPNRQVVGLLGDGDFLMAVQELATAVQYGIPVVYIVANNCGWMSIKDLQTAAYGEEAAFATDFTRNGEACSPDLAAVARAFGCHAERTDRADGIRPALERAFASGGPAVLEVMVCREFPHTGSPATGWWDVPVPEYLPERHAKYHLERQDEHLT